VDSLIGKQVEFAKEDSWKDWHGHSPSRRQTILLHHQVGWQFPYLCLQFGKNILDVIMNLPIFWIVNCIICRQKGLTAFQFNESLKVPVNPQSLPAYLALFWIVQIAVNTDTDTDTQTQTHTHTHTEKSTNFPDIVAQCKHSLSKSEE
jgi:hypothetical protein